MTRPMRTGWRRTTFAIMSLAPWPAPAAPRTLPASAALGVWLIFAPAGFGPTGRASDFNRLPGGVIVTQAVIAAAEGWARTSPESLSGQSAAP